MQIIRAESASILPAAALLFGRVKTRLAFPLVALSAFSFACENISITRIAGQPTGGQPRADPELCLALLPLRWWRRKGGLHPG